MRIKQAIAMVLGSTCVYVVIAACSAGGAGTPDDDGGLLDSARAAIDAMIDNVVSPVPDAKADPPPLETATVPCNQTYSCGGGTCVFAERAFPGRTAADLRTLTAQAEVAAGPSVPPGFTRQAALPFVRDGAAAVHCGVQGPQQQYVQVTFYYQPPGP